MQYHAPQPDVQDNREASPAKWNESISPWSIGIDLTLSRLQSCRNLCRIMAMTHQNSSLHQPNQSGSICLPDSTCSVDSAARYWSGQTSAKPCRKRDLLRKAVGPVSNCVFPTAEPQRYGIKSTKKHNQKQPKISTGKPTSLIQGLGGKKTIALGIFAGTDLQSFRTSSLP